MSLSDDTANVQHDWSWAFGPEVAPREEFRSVPRNPHILVSNRGRAFRELPQSLTSLYYGVCVGNSERRLVHHLVLEAFVGPRPERYHGCHNDGDYLNNNLDNLRWDTVRSNMMDKLKHGTMVNGSQQHTAKLTEADIPKICEAYKSGFTARQLGNAYRIDPETIRQILKFKAWKHVPREPVKIRGDYGRYGTEPADKLSTVRRRQGNDRGTRGGTRT